MAEQAHAFANAERRHLTIVFCDLVESTALSKRLTPRTSVRPLPSITPPVRR